VLPKTNRLKKTKDIELVFKKGKTYKEGCLFFKVFKKGLPVSRFCFIASQKVSKKAAVRNRIKRRMREAIRKELPNIKPGFDGAWLALKGLETKNSKETAEAIKKILRQSGICR